MHRSNNFDGLRLAAALLVIVGHGFHLFGRASETPGLLGYQVSTFGVVVFFSISGYLIAASWDRSPNIQTYLTASSLRIFPALAVAVVALVLVVGPLVSSLSTATYFGSPGTADYLWNLALRPRYALPGVFEHLPYPLAVNGSLWTLPAEFFCYLLVPFLCVRTFRTRMALLGGFLVLSLGLSLVPAAGSAVLYGTRVSDAAMMWVFFASGALLQSAQRYLTRLFHVEVAVALLLLQWLLTTVVPADPGWYAWLLLPYAILTFGRLSTPGVRRTARYGDLSYGVYLWGFPVQQLVLEVFGVLPMPVNLLLTMLTALALARLSWALVEEPALALTRRLGARPTLARPTVVVSRAEATVAPAA